MIFLLLFLVMILVKDMRIASPFRKDSYNESFLSREHTVMINGIFVVFVFIGHFIQYLDEYFTFDAAVIKLIKILGQCVNCTFLFYSGYGINEQLKKQKEVYLKKLACRRFPQLLIRFDLCVLVYILVGYLFGTRYTFPEIVLSLLGLHSAGNSTWYIFYMLCSYLIVFVSFKIVKKESIALFFVFLLSILYTFIMSICLPSQPAYYLTTLVFPLGMVVSHYKEAVTECIRNHFFFCFLGFLLIYVSSFVLRHRMNLMAPFYNLTAMSFALLVLIASSRIQIQSKVLGFLGRNIFYIYILQRMPMLVGCKIIDGGGYSKSVYLPTFYICIAATLVLSFLFRKMFEKMKI